MRIVLLALLALAACAQAPAKLNGTPAPPPAPQTTPARPATNVTAKVSAATAAPKALIYRGPAACEGCPESVAALLLASRFHFQVVYVGPKEAHSTLTPALLATATLYAQPGGDGTVDAAAVHLRPSWPALRAYIEGGGRYLGFCMGGYMAGSNPGLGVLQTDAYIGSKGASVTSDADTTVALRWRGKARRVYFQDGPWFAPKPHHSGAVVLATYASNGKVAALVSPVGSGKVGVVGPHPEADASWFAEAGVANPGLALDLGQDLVEELMR